MQSRPAVTDESLIEITFESKHVRDTYQALEERGVPFEAELRPVTSNEGQDLFAVHLRDPDGHCGTLTGWAGSE